MVRLKWFLVGFGGLFSALNAHAQSLAFTNLSSDQANKIIQELSSNFTFTTVSGASPLGSIFGFELGLVGGVTNTPEINTLAKSADPAIKASQIPHGGLVGLVTVPLGFTFEGSFIPKLGNDQFHFNNLGLAVKWSPTATLLALPFSLAVRAHYMKSTLSFKQKVSSVDATVDVEDKVSGLTLLVSKDFEVVEPYLGLGMVSGSGSFSVAGTTAFFSSGASSYSAKKTSSQILAGLEAKLLMLKLGAEYAHQFGTNSLTAKLALSF